MGLLWWVQALAMSTLQICIRITSSWTLFVRWEMQSLWDPLHLTRLVFWEEHKLGSPWALPLNSDKLYHIRTLPQSDRTPAFQQKPYCGLNEKCCYFWRRITNSIFLSKNEQDRDGIPAAGFYVIVSIFFFLHHLSSFWIRGLHNVIIIPQPHINKEKGCYSFTEWCMKSGKETL